jgi:hypothetical protein
MPSPVQTAAETYIKVWSEHDPAMRAALLEACFAVDGRIVMPLREIRGRAALNEVIEQFLADPQRPRIRVTSVVDALGSTFRFRVVTERSDGTSHESFDAGQIDEQGRIALVLSFGGALADAAPLDV